MTLNQWAEKLTRCRQNKRKTCNLNRSSTFERLGDRITPTVNAFFTAGQLTILGDAADNAIVVSRDAAGAIQVNGGAVHVLGGTPTVANTGRVQIFGLGGNDTLSLNEVNGALPQAILFGGTGNDTLIGGSAADLLFGQAGNDTLLGKANADFLFGGADNDVLTAGAGDDQAYGETGNDRMIWNPGDGSDLNEGGAGADTVEVIGGNAAEAFLATAVNDRVLFERVDPAPFSIVIGTSENLVVNMNGGNDSFATDGNLPGLFVDGGAGNDTIIGGADDDRLVGGDGNDFIDGNQGNDMVFLGAGDDTFRWDLGDGSDAVEGQAGNDRMLFNGSNDSEAIDVFANGGRVQFARNIASVSMDLNDVERIDFNALGGADTIKIGDLSGTDLTEVNINLKADAGGGDGLPDSVFVDGSKGADNVEVTGAGSFYSVLGLQEVVNVGNSEGTLDELVVNLQDGDDAFSAGTLPSGVVMLTVNGGPGDDSILGSQGGDILSGDSGNDFIDGNGGNDVVTLGDGRDTFLWDPGDGSDTVEGQSGSDRMIFNGADANERVDISANGNRVRFFRDAGNNTIDLNGIEEIDFNAFGGTDNITINDLSATDVSVVNLDLNSAGGAGDGQADSVILNGAEVDDVFQIAAIGSTSRIVVAGQFPFVNITGTEGANDRLTVNAFGGNDAVDAGSLPANLIGLTLNGGAGNDTLIGGGGNDLVNGGTGNDMVFLEAGDDTFVWNPGDGSDTVEGMAGRDAMIFNGANVNENITISANGGRVRFVRDAGNVTMDLNGVERIDFNALGGADSIAVNDLSGTDINEINVNLAAVLGDTLGDDQADSITVNGSNRAELIPVFGAAGGILVNGNFLSLQGLPYFMLIRSVDATDSLRINGNGGDDTIDAASLDTRATLTADGGADDDTLIGSPGDDVLLGGAGNDTLHGGPGVDVLDGGSGDNIIVQD